MKRYPFTISTRIFANSKIVFYTKRLITCKYYLNY